MPLTLASEQRRNVTMPAVIAAVVVALAIGAAFYFNPHRLGELRAVHTEVFAPQTTYAAPRGPIHVVGEKLPAEQDLYAVVTVQIKNDQRLPLFVDEIDGQFLSANGEEMDSVAPASTQLDRLEDIFPRIKMMMPHPLLLGDTIPPKASVEGQVLLHFGGLGENDWSGRKPSTLILHFTHQGQLTVTIP